ncbi:DUF2586 family protein [Psychroflexus sp. ALD_RP9]|uniref:DUF2586 family protein n=1 Tax=Psychroflexus sp. ALD_RP9 TaxID=2777186 RepID=UPI001A8F4BF6|nr:DUF2586 family protein [Psychroflexus sp. ALD_RP9]QSS96589.1 hypothetical protein IMZ30_09060 [Psychroflexus sp. ALD_RP9]
MSLNGVEIDKGQLGANRLGSEDAVSAIVFTFLDDLPDFEIKTTRVVFNLNDVRALGLDEQYDGDNGCVAFRHVSEFYRMAGEGTKLYLYNCSLGFDDGAFNATKNLLNEAKGEIKQIAFVNALDRDFMTTNVDGIPAVVGGALPLAQALYDWSFENFMPVQILVEGYGVDATSASSVLDLRDLVDLEADKVSLVCGQDYNYAMTKPAASQKYADVGTALGVLAKAKVHENIGNNELFNLTDATRNAWLEPGIAGQPNSQIADQLATLDAKGYIFGVNYTGLAGVRFNNDHVCAPVVLDADNNMNEHSIAYGRVADKAVRELRRAYLPKVKTTWNVDSKTGKLSSGTIVALEDIGDQVFEDMLGRGEISYGKANIDNESDLLVEKVLRVSYVIVPKGTINKIEGTLNLKTRE